MKPPKSNLGGRKGIRAIQAEPEPLHARPVTWRGGKNIKPVFRQSQEVFIIEVFITII